MYQYIKDEFLFLFLFCQAFKHLKIEKKEAANQRILLMFTCKLVIVKSLLEIQTSVEKSSSVY